MRYSVLLKALLYLSGLLVFLIILTTTTQLHRVTTESVGKERYYVTVRFLEFKRGNVVTFYHVTPHLGKALYTKQVLGVPGDKIRCVDNTIILNGKVLPVQAYSQKGKVVKPLEVLIQEGDNKVIPGGYIFVAGNTPDSYDSRYSEFGLVPMGQVIGRSFPVL